MRRLCTADVYGTFRLHSVFRGKASTDVIPPWVHRTGPPPDPNPLLYIYVQSSRTGERMAMQFSSNSNTWLHTLLQSFRHHQKTNLFPSTYFPSMPAASLRSSVTLASTLSIHKLFSVSHIAASPDAHLVQRNPLPQTFHFFASHSHETNLTISQLRLSSVQTDPLITCL